MKYLFLIVFGVTLVLCSAADAWACTCDFMLRAHLPLKDQVKLALRESRAVFIGQVSEIVPSQGTDMIVTVKLGVERFWKGDLGEEVSLTTGRGGGDCGYQFEVGRKYLVYAYGANKTQLSTNICQRTTALSDAVVDLKWLGKGKPVVPAPRGPERKTGVQALLPVKVEGLYGYINTAGQFVIEPQFEVALEFSEGLAVVGKTFGNDRRYGYINEKGELAIPIMFRDAREFSEGFAVVGLRNQYGFIDTTGKFIAEPVFDKAFEFSEGMARVGNCERTMEGLACRYGFIDKQGKTVIKPQYIYASDFREGLAGFAVENKKGIRMGFIDKSNRVVIKPKFSLVSDFSEGLASVVQNAETYWFDRMLVTDKETSPNRKVAYINKRGSIVITGNFEFAYDFSEGLAKVEIDQQCGYIDKSGKMIIRPGFPTKAVCGDFSEGMASINADNGAKFIDRNGQIVIKTDFTAADGFHGGVARVRVWRGNSDFTYGYVDRSGRIIWRP